jgi:hypothetical protein
MKRRTFIALPVAMAAAQIRPLAQPANTKVMPDERTHDRLFPRPPIVELIDQLPHDWLTAFEDLERWEISIEGMTEPQVRRCRYRPLFHDTHIEITWTSAKEAKILLIPPRPLQLPKTWSAVDFWIGGHPTDFEGPKMECTLHCLDRDGGRREIEICGSSPARRPHAVDLFHRLVPRPLREGLQDGHLRAIEIRVPEADSRYMIHLYAMTFYNYRPRRKYQRPARLPFPTHPDGVVPTPSAPGAGQLEPGEGANAVTRFSFRAEDGSTVLYTYTPQTGALDDVTVSVDGATPFCPCAGGGLVFEMGNQRLVPPYRAGNARLVRQSIEPGQLKTFWQARAGAQTVEYCLSFRIVNRSLVIEAQVQGTSAMEMRIGYPDGPGEKRAIEVPMLVWDWDRWKPSIEKPDFLARKSGRTRSPAILLAHDCFLSAIFDWYVSDASFLYATAESATDAAGFDGGAAYLPVIDQGRNPLREKLILTVSKRFEEVLPNIPNPPSPYGELMRERVYSHGISQSASPVRHENLGIHQVVTIIETYDAACDYGGYRPSNDMGSMDDWIDEPSKTKGGMAEFLRHHAQFRKIGWLTGNYTLYCQMSPIFHCFAEMDRLHDPDGFHPRTWAGTARPVPGESLDYARRQVPKIARACGPQIIYSDGYTNMPAWWVNDYSPGVAGAGKFRETFEQVSLLYMAMREGYHAPVTSEGGMQWMYSGLIDGNMGRTQFNPWDKKTPYLPPPDLVDFQLRKIHLLTVDNCGNDYFETWSPEKRDSFICQTLAYGKRGLWTAYSGEGTETQAMSCRSYFTWHLAQKRYRCVPVERILYHNGEELVDSSAIIRQRKERTGRIYVRYQNGFESWTNLNPKEPWRIQVEGRDWLLPPYGWFQRRQEGWGEFINCYVIEPGQGWRQRVEDETTLLVAAPGSLVRWEDIETDGTVIVRHESAGGARVINVDAFRLRVRPGRLGLPSTCSRVVTQTYNLEGEPVRDDTLPVEDGWVDLSFLAQEQFALVHL